MNKDTLVKEVSQVMHYKGPLVPQVRLVQLEKREEMDYQEEMVSLVIRETRGTEVDNVPYVPQEQKDKRDHLVKMETMAFQEKEVLQEVEVFLVNKASVNQQLSIVRTHP